MKVKFIQIYDLEKKEHLINLAHIICITNNMTFRVIKLSGNIEIETVYPNEEIFRLIRNEEG